MLSADGQVDSIEGTTIHPIWSLDRNDWVPLGESSEGEQLLGADGAATILTHQIFHRSTPVYNIEVHGEHVNEVGCCGLLVHNSCIEQGTTAWSSAVNALQSASKGTKLNFTVKTATDAKQLAAEAFGNMNRYKNYAHDVLHYSKGYEMHMVRNAREAGVHALKHLKWYNNRTSGHIFFLKPN